MTTPDLPASPPSFEALLEDLEAVVTRLERGDAPLDQALAEFERGTDLARRATGILDAAEARVTKLIEARDGLREVPFEPGG
ncbi:MAG: exodeoxyribonuclease VII small subunit [Deltaproteobacteria bacterium HGW-Deltaproteobacteria-14]|jgi:exodeoxyribonuclease VII small subunit|nr:MAG: exodeoxyribonuclease VII small subunit [Deltaproteobacteria bacterium HGW-Deltaproteobacteria-14]